MPYRAALYIPKPLKALKEKASLKISEIQGIMLLLNLKGRDNFRANYLIPAINAGLVAMLYPDNPRRKSQAYYLTQKGLDVLKTE